MKKPTAIFDMAHTIYRAANPAEQQAAKSLDLSSQFMPVQEIDNVLDAFLDLFDQGYKIVIISNSIIQHSRQVLQFLLEKRGVDQEKRSKIFNEIDILTMQYFGSKHDVDSWQQAMQPYSNISYIFEDGEEKLKAAGQAAQNLGSQPELYQSIKEYQDELDEI